MIAMIYCFVSGSYHEYRFWSYVISVINISL